MLKSAPHKIKKVGKGYVNLNSEHGKMETFVKVSPPLRVTERKKKRHLHLYFDASYTYTRTVDEKF